MSFDSYYRVVLYTKDQPFFTEEKDYWLFLSLLEKHFLDNKHFKILAFCLLPQHLNFLLHQKQLNIFSQTFDKLLSDYNQYLTKNGRVKINDSKLQSKEIVLDKVLETSREIHTLPKDYQNYPFSSIRSYFYDDTPPWLDKSDISSLYGSAIQYEQFLKSL